MKTGLTTKITKNTKKRQNLLDNGRLPREALEQASFLLCFSFVIFVPFVVN